jgi:hypothetical protein
LESWQNQRGPFFPGFAKTCRTGGFANPESVLSEEPFSIYLFPLRVAPIFQCTGSKETTPILRRMRHHPHLQLGSDFCYYLRPVTGGRSAAVVVEYHVLRRGATTTCSAAASGGPDAAPGRRLARLGMPDTRRGRDPRLHGLLRGRGLRRTPPPARPKVRGHRLATPSCSCSWASLRSSSSCAATP